jgi:hypothetical protein
MRYLILLHGDEAAEAALNPEERRAIVDGHIAFSRRARERGIEVSGEALARSSDGIVIRRDGSVTDGPFAETKEQLGGFYLVDCESREQMLDLVREIPDSPGLVIEVRPLQQT